MRLLLGIFTALVLTSGAHALDTGLKYRSKSLVGLGTDISTTGDIYTSRIYLTQNGGFNTPVITRSSDTDTGIAFGTNEIFFNAGNGTRMSVVNTGDVRVLNNLSVGNGNNGPTTNYDLDVGGNVLMRGGYMTLTPQGTEPTTCAASVKGAMAMTSTTTELCFCDGSTWKQVDSGSACSW